MTLKTLFAYLANKFFWVPWSNFRYRKEERHSKELLPRHRVSSLSDIQKLARVIYRDFKYTKDGPDLLWDAVCPPPYAYEELLSGDPFRDDCDGFHSLLYHCLTQSGIPCYLLIVNAPGGGHCVLTFYFEHCWHVLDYTSLYTNYPTATLSDTIAEYADTYVTVYHKKGPAYFTGLLSYDYESGKFRYVDVSDRKDPNAAQQQQQQQQH